jgi:hypothetical protein
MRYAALGLCLFVAACAADSPTAPTSPSAIAGGDGQTRATGGSALPFKGTLEATETITGDNPSQHHLVATGEATHLGRYTMISDFTVTSPPPRAVGTAVWTAADGSQLFTTTAGEAVVVPPILTATETHIITGGTGRFAEASGTIVIVRDLNVVTLASSGSISGTINRHD